MIKKILIVEDDALTSMGLKLKLESLGLSLIKEVSSLENFENLSKLDFDMAFVDLDLEEKLAGLKILTKLKENKVYSVITSARGEENIIEKCYEIGCEDYLQKPYKIESIKKIIQKSSHKNLDFKESLRDRLNLSNIELEHVHNQVEKFLLSDLPMFISGETGTGKTRLAKLIHSLNSKDMPFVHVNCAELDDQLVDSMLFGHVKGAFTGAVNNKKGFLELANNGILFLDEIATMPLNTQKKLLKAIEEKSFYPVGSEREVYSNFRIITATCESLDSKITKGEFREDFFFRLRGIEIKLLSLREKKHDLLSIINGELAKSDRKIVISREAKDEILEYSWPGNHREIVKVAQSLILSDKGIVTKDDIRIQLKSSSSKNSGINLSSFHELALEIGLGKLVEKLEDEIMSDRLRSNENQVRKTMSELKISNNTFYRIKSRLSMKSASNE